MATERRGDSSRPTKEGPTPIDIARNSAAQQATHVHAPTRRPLLAHAGRRPSRTPSGAGSLASRPPREPLPPSSLKPTPNEILVQAAIEGSDSKVTQLLTKRTSFNIITVGSEADRAELVDDDGVTQALHAAILAKQPTTAQILIQDKGIRMQNTHLPYSRTVLHEAIAVGLERLALVLLRRPDSMRCLDLQDNLGRTLLHDAAAMGCSQMVDRLLLYRESAKTINLRDQFGRAPLHESVVLGDRDIMRELLSNGAELDMPDNELRTPLHRAVMLHSWHEREDRTVHFLVENGAKVNTKDGLGNSPLHEASQFANEPMIRLLLRNGADPDCLNDDRKTPQELLPDTESGRAAKRIFYTPRAKWKPKTDSSIPVNPPVCSSKEQSVCDNFFITIRFYWRRRALSWSQTASVRSVVYSEGIIEGFERDFIEIIKKTLVREASNTSMDGEPEVDKKEIWRWIHLPANNMTWLKDLVWRLTHNANNKAPLREALRFVERNIRDRKGYNKRNTTRMPHVADSWRDDAGHVDPHPDSSRLSHTSVSMGGTDNEDSEEGPPSPSTSRRSTSRRSGTPKHRSIDKGKELLFADNDVSTPGLGQWNPPWHDERLEYQVWRSRIGFPNGRKLSLVIPYFDFETEQYLIRQGEQKDMSRQFRRMKALEQSYPPFRGSYGLQTPQTLDQSYYDMLSTEELMVRDRDQVVYKWFKPSTAAATPVPNPNPPPASIHLTGNPDEATEMELPRTVVRSPSLSASSMVDKQPKTDMEHDKLVPEAAGNGRLPGPASKEDLTSAASFGLGRRDTLSNVQLKKLILIHQLWLWKIDENTVITSFPERWHTGVEDTLLETIRQSGVSEFRNPEDLIVHILYECVSFLEKYRDAGLGNHILDIFESSIATRANQEVSYFKKFNASIQGAQDREIEQHRPKDDIDGEVNLIYEVKDIRDELHLIQRVFKSQAAVIDKFSKLFWPGIGEEDKQYREKFIEDCGVGDLIERAEKLDEDANRTLEGLDYLVQVKQAQSSLNESVSAGEMNIKAFEEAKRSQKLNNYIMLFTTISVVFTPLSFMTSLFAIPIDEFPQDDKGALSYTWDWFLGRMFVGELVSLAATAVGIYFLWVPKEKRGWKFWKTFRQAEQRRGKRRDSIRTQQARSFHNLRDPSDRPAPPSPEIRAPSATSSATSSAHPWPRMIKRETIGLGRDLVGAVALKRGIIRRETLYDDLERQALEKQPVHVWLNHATGA